MIAICPFLQHTLGMPSSHALQLREGGGGVFSTAAQFPPPQPPVCSQVLLTLQQEQPQGQVLACRAQPSPSKAGVASTVAQLSPSPHFLCLLPRTFYGTHHVPCHTVRQSPLLCLPSHCTWDCWGKRGLVIQGNSWAIPSLYGKPFLSLGKETAVVPNPCRLRKALLVYIPSRCGGSPRTHPSGAG